MRRSHSICAAAQIHSRFPPVAVAERESQLPMFNWVQQRTHWRIDPITPLCMVALSTIGVFFIYSAQVFNGGNLYLQQIGWLGLGAVLYVTVSLVNYRHYLRHSHWFMIAAIPPLILVLFDAIGIEVYGAQRWLEVPGVGVRLQPSEPAKIAVLMVCASILARSRIGTLSRSMVTLGKLALAAGVPMILIMAQPDLGSALVIPPMVFALLYASNLSQRFFLAALAAFTLVVGIVALDTYFYNRFLETSGISPKEAANKNIYGSQHSWVPYLKDYQRNRVLSYAMPEKIDPTGISWNINQTLITVGSGGTFGKGWTQGTQARLGYLPRAVAHNDFIFSVLAEEKGFLGSVTVLGLFGVVLANGVRIASLARDRFGTLLALGATTLMAVHIFVNIGMTIGLLPIKGLPLPFLSYGGSFLLSCCILQGLVQSVYRFRKEF
jgi:rod shape determining protein RodA